MRVYIAGKITGLPWPEVVLKFASAEKMLRAKGHDVVNPITLVGNPDASWSEAMRICLEELPKCDRIFMLADSVDSRGAKIELQLAITYNLEIDWEK